MKIANLRCEYFNNPLGLDTVIPHLSWELDSSRRGARQAAYRLVCKSDGEVIWDSGRVESARSIHVPYGGPALRSRQRVDWEVRIWDELGEESVSQDPAWWEMGLLEASDWQAKWIGSGLCGGARVTAPCPFLRKDFVLDQEIEKARLYISALGLYEVEINGRRIGEEIFAPGWTDYHKRVQYQVYDVTALLQRGSNAIGAVLGDGWFCGYIATLDRQYYGDRPRLLAQLEIDLKDGRKAAVLSDSSWRWSSGPILESDLIAGESYDAQRELPGWSLPGYDDSGWQAAMLFPAPEARLVARANPPVKRQGEIRPVSPPKPWGPWAQKNWIFDLGQNMVGWARLKIQGPRGLTVRLRFAEMLKPDGSLYLEALRSARATDYYTLKGEGVEVYEPRFTFHGFRYVEVTGVSDPPTEDMITGIVLHSDIPAAGEFECSDPLINQLQHNIQWGQKGNFLEVPTDCPQRDERLGWTGDAQVFAPTAAFNRDVASFFVKWMNDFEDAQSGIGQIPPVIPKADPFDLSNDGGPAWADAVMIIPWTMYQIYGDMRFLSDHYGMMKRFVEYLRATSLDLIRVHPATTWEHGNWPGFGDWLAQDGSGKTDGGTPKDLIGTAFFAHSARLLAAAAGVLGKAEDQAAYTALADDVRRAFVRRFVTRDGLVTGMTQTCYVLPLYFDLLPEDLREAAVEELVRDVQNRGDHLSTGFVGSSYLPFVLTKAGRLDLMYRLLFQKTWPSWLYAVTQGATTIWERWDGWTAEKGFQTPEMNSFNHYAYGAIGNWLYSVVAGIQSGAPGYQHQVFRPLPGGGLTSARARTHTMYGDVESSWSITKGDFVWRLQVPANSTATAWIPAAEGKVVLEGGEPVEKAEGVRFMRYQDGAAVYELVSGEYVFTVLGG